MVPFAYDRCDPSCVAVTSAPGAPCTADVTAEGLLAIMRQLQAVPRPEYDALVVLPNALAGLRECVPLAGSVPALQLDRLAGIPIYEARDAAHAALLVADLKGKGKRPAIVCAPGDPQEVANLPPLPQMPAPSAPAVPGWLTAR